MSAIRASLSIFFLSALLPIGILNQAMADEIVSRWVGGASGRWAIPSNWEPVGVPDNGGGNTYHVVVDGNPGQDVEVLLDIAPVNVLTLTIEAGHVLTMDAPATLFIEGGLIDLDGTLQINPQNVGLARLFITTQDAQVIGDGEIHMLGEPGRCLLQIGGTLTLTLGDSVPGPGNDTVLRGSGVIQGGTGSTLEVLERIVSNIDGVDLIFFILEMDVDNVIEAAEGLLSFVENTVSGSGAIENNGTQTVGIRTSNFDGLDGLTFRNGNFRSFAGPVDFNEIAFDNIIYQSDETISTNMFNITASQSSFQSVPQLGNAPLNMTGTNQLSFSSLNGITLTIDGSVSINNSAFDEFTATGSIDATMTATDSTFNDTTFSEVDFTFDGNNTINASDLNNIAISWQDNSTMDIFDSTISNSTLEGDANLELSINASDLNVVAMSWQDNSTVSFSDSTITNSTMQGDPDSNDDNLAMLGAVNIQDSDISDLSMSILSGTGLQMDRIDIGGSQVSMVSSNGENTVWNVDGVVFLDSEVSGDPSSDGDQLIVQGDSTLTNTSLIDLDVVVDDQVELSTTNLTASFTSFRDIGAAVLRMQSQANIESGTFDDIDVIFSGESFIWTANGPILLRNLTLTVEGQTTVQTDTAATIQIENTTVTGDSKATITGGANVDMTSTGENTSLEVLISIFGSVEANAILTNISAAYQALAASVSPDATLLASDIALAFENYVVAGSSNFSFTGVDIRKFVAENTANINVDAGAGPNSGFASIVSVIEQLTFAMTDEGSWYWGPDSVLAMTGGIGAPLGDWENWGRLEVGGTDLGTDPDNHQGDPTGFEMNFDMSVLRIGPGAHAYLEDLIDNANRNGPFGALEALYVDTLEFADPDAQLNLNGIHLYYGNLIGDASQIIDVPVDSQSQPAIITDFEIVYGSLLGGGIPELIASDDQYLHTQSGPRSTFIVQLNAVTSVPSPNMMDITIESRVDRTFAIVRVKVLNQSTGQFEQIHQYLIGASDTTEIISNIDTTNRVGAGGEIEIEITHTSITPFSASTFESLFDEVRIDVQ